MAGKHHSSSSSIPNPETHDRHALREHLARDIESYLDAGGRVEVVEKGKRSDPPRKPKSRYGSQPI